MPVTNPGGAVKAGTVAHFAASTAPAGWLKANGAAISRSAYAGLFAAIGTTYGAGDGSTTFNLPDLRGEFVRSLDDGRGVDSGRGIGTAQAQDTAPHFHNLGTKNNAGLGGGKYGTIDTGISSSNYYSTGLEAATTLSEKTSTTGTTETRPRNVALLACIKY